MTTPLQCKRCPEEITEDQQLVECKNCDNQYHRECIEVEDNQQLRCLVCWQPISKTKRDPNSEMEDAILAEHDTGGTSQKRQPQPLSPATRLIWGLLLISLIVTIIAPFILGIGRALLIIVGITLALPVVFYFISTEDERRYLIDSGPDNLLWWLLIAWLA